LAKYDGNTISIIPDSAGQGWNYHVHYNPVVYNNELYLLYGQDDMRKYLAKYDGKKITVLNNPDATGYFIDLLSPTVWHNKLYCSYLEYDTAFGYIPVGGHIAVYDGDSIKLLNNPDNGLGFGIDSVNYTDGSGGSEESDYQLIDYSGNLFAPNYNNRNKKFALAKFDGTNVSLYNNPDTSDVGVKYLIPINNGLYILYQNRFGKFQIGQYTGTGNGFLTYKNPDEGTFALNIFTSFNEQVYFLYQNALGKYQIATLDTSSKLPVSLSYFTATAVNRTIQTNWQTATELNTSHFIIQHSTDGSSFTDIGTIKAIGSGSNSYSFTDTHPTNGINYYRLKSVDKDGGSSFSKVVSAEIVDSRYEIVVYPNPAKSSVTVRGSHISSVQVIDNMGRVVKVVELKDATNPVLSVSGLGAGVYHLMVQATDGVVSGKQLII